MRNRLVDVWHHISCHCRWTQCEMIIYVLQYLGIDIIKRRNRNTVRPSDCLFWLDPDFRTLMQLWPWLKVVLLLTMRNHYWNKEWAGCRLWTVELSAYAMSCISVVVSINRTNGLWDVTSELSLKQWCIPSTNFAAWRTVVICNPTGIKAPI